MRVNVRVYPAARQTSVGGRYGKGKPPVLIVRVTAPAVDGKANRAVTEALASALGVRHSAIQIITGATSRNKLVEVHDVDPGVVERLLAL